MSSVIIKICMSADKLSINHDVEFNGVNPVLAEIGGGQSFMLEGYLDVSAVHCEVTATKPVLSAKKMNSIPIYVS